MKLPILRFLATTFIASFTFWACQKDAKTLQDTPSVKADKKWSNSEIDAFIHKTILEKDQVFDWKDASDEMLWSALTNSDNLLAVGFKPVNATDAEATQFNATNDADWKVAKNDVTQLILASERRANPSVDFSKFEMGSDFDNLNAFYIRVTGFETVQKLRQSPLVRYIYPVGYSPEDHNLKLRSDSGCDGYVGETLYSPADYTTISPNAKQSWTYSFSQISSAWARSTGAGIGVMVIDAGVSSAQAMFSTTNYRNGASSPYRTFEAISRYPSQLNFWGTQVVSTDPNPYSSCGHGTTMTGIISSPRNNLGASVGVAYNCNVVSCRAVEDVIISDSKEELGVAAALNLAASRADIRIVSMSLGSITTRSVIGDAIKSMRTKGKLPFCAAGTSTSFTTWYGVVYPASMSEAIAVTGVTNSYQKCDVCHSGSAVDFTAVMDRDSDGKSVVTLAVTGNVPATVGGSSASTATVAGIAALVWGRNTSQTSSQVLSRMRSNSQYATSVNGQFGYGVVNANGATNF